MYTWSTGEGTGSERDVFKMGEPAAKKLCTATLGAVKRVSVEGNIAAGKSTFLRLLEEANPAYRVVSEPLTRWLNVPASEDEMSNSQKHGGNLLDMFYKDPKRWAYSFQTYACISRLRSQLKPLSPTLTAMRNPVLFYERSVFSDRFVFASNCHATGLMTDTEWHLYCDWHSFLSETLPLKFDAIVYLRTDPKICFTRLRKRDRPEEAPVTQSYLESIHRRHEEWLVEKSIYIPPLLQDVPILTLDCNPEFESDQEQTKRLIKKVSDFLCGEIHVNHELTDHHNSFAQQAVEQSLH